MLSKSKITNKRRSKRKTVNKRSKRSKRSKRRTLSKKRTLSKRSKRKQKGGSLAVIPGISIPSLDESNNGLIIKEVVANVAGC